MYNRTNANQMEVVAIFFTVLLHSIVTSDAQFWAQPIIGMIKSMCILFNKRDISGTKPNTRIASLFGLDSESE